MTFEDNENNNIIDVPLTTDLEKTKAVKYIRIYRIYDSLEIPVNHRAEEDKIHISKLSKKSIETINKEIDKQCKDLEVDDKARRLLKINITNKWKLITGLCDPCDQPKNENICTEIIKIEGKDQSEQQEQNNKEGKIIEDDSLEIINPSQALRKDIGKYKVKGTVVSIGKVFRMVLGVNFYCMVCRQKQQFIFELPMYDVPGFLFPKCQFCKRRETVVGNPIFVNAINIELQNYNMVNNSESLPVFLFGEYTEGIRVGEIVETPGVINILNVKKRHQTFFYGESIKYLNRENHDLTKNDIRIIKRFNDIWKNKVITKLVEMFDPNIVEQDVPKKAILIGAANTSEKVGRDSEHIDILFIGPPGLIKSGLLETAITLVPGSNIAGGQYSTGKSLTAVIDKFNEQTIMRAGLIPRSRGGICAIDEFGRMDPEDQDKMLRVMQERGFPFDKGGISTYVPAPTTILASANPKNNDNWIDDDKIDLSQFPFIATIIDRFDLIITFHYKKPGEETNKFIDDLLQVEAKREAKKLPNYRPFVIKYLKYAKQFDPVITDEIINMVSKFCKDVFNEGFRSPRIIFRILKIIKAVARLKLKNVADKDDADEAMEFYRATLIKFNKIVEIPKDPRDLAYEKTIEIVKRFEKFGGISLEELFKIMCEEDRQLSTYFGYDDRKSLKIRDNKKTRVVYDLLKKQRHPNIVIKDGNPIVLKWVCDPCDPCDPCDLDKNKKNVEKNNENVEKNDLDLRSHGSHMAHSEEVKETKEEKFAREQEEQKTWDSGLEST